MTMEEPKRMTLTDGSPVPADDSHKQLREDGQQKGYVVLSSAERAKGFVEPVRHSYVHVGRLPPANLRDLTDDEKERYGKYGYVKYESYGPEQAPVCGTFWTQEMLDSVTGGCGKSTEMGDSLAETYAADPEFYGKTFCCHCRKHFPVGENGEFVWANSTQRVGTRSVKAPIEE
jgi:hypothetical protein